MKQPNKFQKSNFYIFVQCNYWTLISTIELFIITILTTSLFIYFKNYSIWYFYALQESLGILFYILSNQGMIEFYKERKKLYLMLADSIESNKPFKKSMILEMMTTRCERHIVKNIERVYGIKLV